MKINIEENIVKINGIPLYAFYNLLHLTYNYIFKSNIASFASVNNNTMKK